MKDHVDHGEKICFCPLYGLIDLIAKKWSLLIIALLGNEGAKGFNELRELKGISPKTLLKTLKEPEKHGLIERRVLNTSPPRVTHLLPSRGWELRKLLIPLLK